MKNKNFTLYIISTSLGCVALIFLGLFLSYLNTANVYKKQLENMYEKNYYEMVSYVNTLEVDMSKLVATTSLDSQSELLGTIHTNSALCVNNINVLPFSSEKVSSVKNYFNSLYGFSESLIENNKSGNVISDDDLVQLDNMHTRLQEIQYDLNVYLAKMESSYSIIDDIDFNNSNNNNYSGGMIDNESSNAEIPTLIYDGPFSDSVLNKEIKGLPDTTITLEQAEEKLHNIFTKFSIEYIGDTVGKFETYNFDVKGDIDLYVSVTKRGGMLLSITSFGSGTEQNKLSLQEGLDLAETFASDCGFENMYNVWYQNTGKILYVNLAPIVNHVIYYSDLIKVKIDLSLGLVVGWEASNYATNHTDREFTSSIGILDGEESVSSLMEIVERNLTIIPGKYVGEVSAYEYICKWKNYTYYIYVDSNTGKEVNILRVVNTTNGDLLM